VYGEEESLRGIDVYLYEERWQLSLLFGFRASIIGEVLAILTLALHVLIVDIESFIDLRTKSRFVFTAIKLLV